MAKEIKFSDDELQSLNELSQGYQNIQEAEVQMESDYSDLQEKERELVQQLNEKYGPGQLDPQTGVFTPAPEPEEQEVPEQEDDSAKA